MNLYSMDIPVWATIYVKAKDEKEAKRIIRAQASSFLEAGTSQDFNEMQFDNPDMPNISYSPAMTVAEKFAVTTARLNLAAEDVPESENS